MPPLERYMDSSSSLGGNSTHSTDSKDSNNSSGNNSNSSTISRSSSSRRNSKVLSSSSTTATTTSTTATSPSPSPSPRTLEYETKNALQGTVGSILALLDFLIQNGISSASIEELRYDVSGKKRNVHTILHVLERAQEYASLVQTSPSLTETTIYLLLNAWTHLCKYVSFLYRIAHKVYNDLRHKHQMITHTYSHINLHMNEQYNNNQHYPHSSNSGGGLLFAAAAAAYATSQVGSSSSGDPIQRIRASPMQRQQQLLVQKALKNQIELGEQCCTCQKGLLLIQAHEKRTTKRKMTMIMIASSSS